MSNEILSPASVPFIFGGAVMYLVLVLFMYGTLKLPAKLAFFWPIGAPIYGMYKFARAVFLWTAGMNCNYVQVGNTDVRKIRGVRWDDRRDQYVLVAQGRLFLDAIAEKDVTENDAPPTPYTVDTVKLLQRITALEHRLKVLENSREPAATYSFGWHQLPTTGENTHGS